MDTFTTALEPNELLVELRFPVLAARTGSAYEKLANKASHYAIAGCAALITRGTDGTCSAASIAITGATVRTIRASAVESALVGSQLDEATISAAVSHATDGESMISDIHGSEEYRRKMAAVVARRAILKAIERI
ncbi:FAD binding domain-containing protein [Dictyobacter kobayashii]|uniref:FAD binding domain-containing protein n=1 Tax=Dictyobacter kobayashii TaxID=2014872 RepID=UPI001FE90531|nr:hypothetical protein [Dictyobacter kobayashii]